MGMKPENPIRHESKQILERSTHTTTFLNVPVVLGLEVRSFSYGQEGVVKATFTTHFGSLNLHPAPRPFAYSSRSAARCCLVICMLTPPIYISVFFVHRRAPEREKERERETILQTRRTKQTKNTKHQKQQKL